MKKFILLDYDALVCMLRAAAAKIKAGADQLGQLDSAIGDTSQIDARMLASMFEAGLAKLRTISRAEVGDKTMIDALVPAVEALKNAAEEGDSVARALEKAADAAQAGAERTKDFEARFGKARNLGQRSIGYQDPGATSMAMLFRGFAEGAVLLGG